VLGRVARGDYVPPLEVDPEYPAWLTPVIARTLALDPAVRPQTAGALADELDELTYATFERGSPTRVAAMMHGSFGDAPPVTSVAELSLVGAPVPTTRNISRRRARALPWLGGAAMAGLLVGAWAWGRAAAQAEARPSTVIETSAPSPEASASTVTPAPAAPIVVPTPLVVAPPVAADAEVVEIVAADEAPPEKASRPPTSSKSSRPNKPKRKPKSSDAPASGLEDLYPPGHPK
jgi:hypothetical protein